jgi:hypothetical protein
VTDKQITTCLQGWEVTSKYEMAVLLGKEFPLLAWKLPRERKAWQTEQWNMPIFDAAALGLAYLLEKPREL